MKEALIEQNPVWAKAKLGRVRCMNCDWKGQFEQLLAERDNRILYCPKCTSSRWHYDLK